MVQSIRVLRGLAICTGLIKSAHLEDFSTVLLSSKNINYEN